MAQAQKKSKTSDGILNTTYELLSLNDDTLKKILGYLPAPDAFRFMLTCVKLYTLLPYDERNSVKDRYILKSVLCLTNRQTEKCKIYQFAFTSLH